jgi:phage-related protein (TIGR01555 family)
MGTVVAIRDSLYNFVMGLGTSRDSRTASVYNFVPMARDQLEAAFRSDWIARKIVLAPAEDATREWREWQASNKQIEAIENYEKKLHLQQKLKRAVMLARLYGGSALVMGVPIGRAEEELDY